MITLTEAAAEEHLAATAFTPAAPGLLGLTVELLLERPGLPQPLVESLAARPRMRHGYLTARSARVLVASGPPSPGIESCAERMAQDLDSARALVTGHGLGVLDTAADATPGAPQAYATAGVRVALEAGTEDAGPGGTARRWQVAQAVAPVLAAAFANSPLRRGRPTGWRSTRLALRHPAGGGVGGARLSGTPGPGAAGSRRSGAAARASDPGADWAAVVLDAPVAGAGSTPPSFRDWLRTGGTAAPTLRDLERHLRTVRPPVAARGHLEIDVADRQPGDGWRVPLAVIAALVDDPGAGDAALAATAPLAGTPGLWSRAARAALTDPALAVAARQCFLAAYAALARHGVARPLRDAVAGYLERYVLRGRCPADDVLDRGEHSIPRL
ncbi:glutamate--cysteine ligase [Krasilnikovia cinnamomea]|uniref:glutamate--cysteine ligase n=1 Tax=Krasilnikovia cinnamomea TaxID=349313 RepID=A0A4Q7ZT27_9ACTN|nr:glutamate-cysteine ligase family protein [Krasilnikovia cinnamomea]RZU54367.1 glutamate--cysteine ligase [Krasilnikovia cinnamomea]